MTMNRNDWEKQVYASDLAPTARLVALVVGSFGNWTNDKNVWPSTKAIADMAGIHRDTAQRYMDAFVEQGWLEVVKVREHNIKEYKLCTPVASPSGILAKGSRANNLPNVQASAQEGSCLSDTEQLPNSVGAVASALGTNLKEPNIKNLKNNTTDPDGPVVIEIHSSDEIPLSLSERSTTAEGGRPENPLLALKREESLRRQRLIEEWEAL